MENWVGWNEWKGGKNNFSRDFVFSLIKFSHEPDKWLFDGIVKVIDKYEDSYELELQDTHKDLIDEFTVKSIFSLPPEARWDDFASLRLIFYFLTFLRGLIIYI